jgi:hypothetical protein
MEGVLAHETLHWLGFTHEWDANNTDFSQPLNVMYYSSDCRIASSPHTGSEALLRPNVASMLRQMTYVPSSSNNALFTNLACYEPFNNPLLGDSASDFGDESAVGMSTGFTDNTIYGVQTGSSHKSCGFFSSGQVCAIPSGRETHWCFDPFSANATFRQQFLSYTGLALGENKKFYGWGFTYHPDCNDEPVELVIGANACPGTDSANIDGYVCSTFPGSTTERALTLIDSSGFHPQGSFVSWGADHGFIIVNIDTADINRVPAGGSAFRREKVFQHAAIMGLLWPMGIGSRTDVTNRFESRAVQPYDKVGTALPFSSFPQGNWLMPGSECKLNFAHQAPQGLYRVDAYCGAD